MTLAYPDQIMQDWFETMEERLWLLPDEKGEEEARFIKKALLLRKGQAVLDAPCVSHPSHLITFFWKTIEQSGGNA